MDYGELVNRNWGYIAPDEQQRIRKARVLSAGCGVGSNVVLLAARTGFTRFVLADGDQVEVNNLNRQAFRQDQVGRNKAEATADLIREINPESEVTVIPSYVAAEDCAALVNEVDLVLNMVDPDEAIFALNDAARRQNKVSLFPMNVGFGGVVLAFTPDSATLEDMLGGKASKEEVFPRLFERVAYGLPHVGQYMLKLADVRDEIVSGAKPGPQLGVASSITASLMVSAMVRSTLGLPLKATPRAMALDAYSVIEE